MECCVTEDAGLLSARLLGRLGPTEQLPAAGVAAALTAAFANDRTTSSGFLILPPDFPQRVGLDLTAPVCIETFFSMSSA